MRSASDGCERPEKTMSRFCGPRSSQWPGCDWVTVPADSRPGRTSSVAALPGCIPLLVLLAWPSNAERIGGDVLRDDRASCDPCSVPHLYGCDETIVDCSPDVAADRGAALRRSWLVAEVRGDRPGSDVRVGADVGVAKVRQVGNLRPIPDGRVLD